MPPIVQIDIAFALFVLSGAASESVRNAGNSPSELIMTSLFDEIDFGGPAEPEVPVELFGDGFGGIGAAFGVVADAGLDGLDSAEPAVADQFAGQAEASVGALLAADLEDGVLPSSDLDQSLSLGDGQGQGLLAVDVLAAVRGLDGDQGVPVEGTTIVVASMSLRSSSSRRSPY